MSIIEVAEHTEELISDMREGLEEVEGEDIEEENFRQIVQDMKLINNYVDYLGENIGEFNEAEEGSFEHYEGIYDQFNALADDVDEVIKGFKQKMARQQVNKTDVAGAGQGGQGGPGGVIDMN